MVSDLKLSGTDLIVYAIIYGFSQDGKSSFHGGLSYLIEWTNVSKNTVLASLKYLCKNGFIVKSITKINGIKYANYQCRNCTSAEIALPKIEPVPVQKLDLTSAEIAPNNKEYNKEYNIEGNSLEKHQFLINEEQRYTKDILDQQNLPKIKSHDELEIEVTAWCKENWETLKMWYGTVGVELNSANAKLLVTKFISHYSMDLTFNRSPIRFFSGKFKYWLVNEKQFQNKNTFQH